MVFVLIPMQVFAVYRKINAEGNTVSGVIIGTTKGIGNGAATALEAVATTSGQSEPLPKK